MIFAQSYKNLSYLQKKKGNFSPKKLAISNNYCIFAVSF